jgi:hypothetical protein
MTFDALLQCFLDASVKNAVLPTRKDIYHIYIYMYLTDLNNFDLYVSL